MPVPKILVFENFEDSGVTAMARVEGNDAANIQQADIDSIAYTVTAEDSDATETASGSLTVSNVVFDTLQTDARWDVDSTGYNFRHQIAATAFPSGGTRYRIEYLFTPSGGENFHVVYENQTIDLRRS